MADKFNKECLEKHNQFRSKHGCPAIAYSAELARSAQEWAEHCAQQGRLEHSSGSSGKIGENVAMKWVEGGAEFTGAQATCQWYSEIKDFIFKSENQTNCGHFSQVVWKTTKEAGFGRAVDSKSGKVFVVGQYRPAGNFMNRWNDNIPSTLSGKIEVPTEEDIMGPDVRTQGGPKLKGDLGGKEGDILVSKATKSKTVNGMKTVLVTETYQKPDGSKYTVTKETKDGLESKMGNLGLQGGDNRSHGKSHTSSSSSSSVSRHDSDHSRDKKDKNQLQVMLGPDTGNLRDDVLDAHNAYRKLHGAHPLKPNRELDRMAQEWADHLAATNTFKHSTHTFKGAKLGENIACKWGSGVSGCKGREVVHQWYSEESKFEYGQSPRHMDAGHFTQVVWADSEQLGVGHQKDRSGKHITVCNYYPAGNIIGKFPLNVQPPRSH